MDIYAPSTIVHGALTVTVATAWPYGEDVTVTVASTAPGAIVDLALRMPAWVAAPAVAVSLNGAPAAFSGTRGSYLHIARAWGAADARTFPLPLRHPYTGVTQLPPPAPADLSCPSPVPGVAGGGQRHALPSSPRTPPSREGEPHYP